MSISTPNVTSTGINGQPLSGTQGSTLSNPTATQLNGNEFLQLMMVQLQNQDPTSPSNQDPTQFMAELAQLTQVQQETKTAQSTAQAASQQAVATAVGLIGDTVTYLDTKTGKTVSGEVQSVQITAAGPSLTVNGVAGVAPASISAVTPTAPPVTGTGTAGA